MSACPGGTPTYSPGRTLRCSTSPSIGADDQSLQFGFCLFQHRRRLIDARFGYQLIWLPSSFFEQFEILLGFGEKSLGSCHRIAAMDYIFFGDRSLSQQNVRPLILVARIVHIRLSLLHLRFQRRNFFRTGHHLQLSQVGLGIREIRLPHLEFRTQLPVVETKKRRT